MGIITLPADATRMNGPVSYSRATGRIPAGDIILWNAANATVRNLLAALSPQ